MDNAIIMLVTCALFVMLQVQISLLSKQIDLRPLPKDDDE